MTRLVSGPGGSSRTLRAVAYDSIKGDILAGRLRPGAAISEAERAVALGISRTPIREALQALAQEGLVEVFAKRGTFVARLSARDVRESFEMREAIETSSARLAAERRTDEDLHRMRVALGDEPAAAGDAAPADEPASEVQDGQYAWAADFHRLIVQVARNRYLEQAFDGTAGRIDLASRLAARIAAQSGPDATHHAVYEAIARGDGPAAEEAMRRHIRGHAEALLKHLR